jgi:hypothetical protein
MRDLVSKATRAVRPFCAVLAALVACTASADQTGVVTGSAPICYGPGPNDNLKPIITIRAVRADGLSHAIRVRTADEHHTYRMTLPPGAYKISTYSGSVRVVVRAHNTTRNADLPEPGCF